MNLKKEDLARFKEVKANADVNEEQKLDIKLKR